MVAQFHGKYSVEEFDRYFILFYATTNALPATGLIENKEIIPEGLRLIQNFVSEKEEKDLITQIEASEGDWEMYDCIFIYV